MKLKIQTKKSKLSLLILGAIVFFVSSFPAVLLAKRTYGASGCGLGARVVGRNPNRAIQLIGLSTNHFSAPTRLSAITSGTSHCLSADGDNSYYLRETQKDFVSVNYSILEQEMASGQGEKLEAFANVLGCPYNNSFINFARQNQQDLFQATASNKEANKFVTLVRTKLNANKKLNNTCRYI